MYPAQEEAVLEWMSGQHVILNTPTGSGKSLVALAVHFKALCQGKRAWYTSPIKALVNEKFFELCTQLGPENVGMMTGDAAVNQSAPIMCCTAEVLANTALRDGAHSPVDSVVMDEFHYYSDPDRGMAWQIPLLTLPHARFLLMSATLGDVSMFVDGIPKIAGGTVALVTSVDRPVPLHFSYRTTPVQESIVDLVESGQAPVYVVNFTQREASEQAQSLTSINVTSKEEKRSILDTLQGFKFDTPYGKDVKRLLSHGVGVHHAGLLPKYRTLVERLAQKGLLKLICGTDTLGVGVNVPIRTVLFAKLCKYDGIKVGILAVRDFKQIGGRAGRKGFDDRGWVVAQAPEHVIDNLRLEAKAAGGKKKKFVRRKPPDRGYVPWDESTFDRLGTALPEPLTSQFAVTHGMLLSVLDREFNVEEPHGGYRRVVDLIGRSYEREGARKRHRRHAAVLFRSLVQAGVVEAAKPPGWNKACVRVGSDLQNDFSLHHSLSLYLLSALAQLPRDGDPEAVALNVFSLVEAILEHPRVVLMRQVDRLKGDLVAQLKNEGVEYDQRMEQLERVDHAKPLAEFVYDTFNTFRITRPWVRDDTVRPKSIARELLERYMSFNDYVKEYGLARSEGVLMRYLSQAYKTVIQNVPAEYHDEALLDLLARLRAVLSRADSSLVAEWERMARGETVTADEAEEETVAPYDLAKDERGLMARVRAEMHGLVKVLAAGDYDEAIGGLRVDPDDLWTADRIEGAMAAVVDDVGTPRFSHEARFHRHTRLVPREPRVWTVQQVLVGADGPTDWMLEGDVDLTAEDATDGPLVWLRRITV
ncbi:MAG: DUF3516 domain-containing protein [Nannocystaceae bacterium]|nr:DUF3516 domain-containing protein [Nannocystaceae bacterium]